MKHFRPLLDARAPMVVGLVVGCAAIVAATSEGPSETARAVSIMTAPLVADPIQNGRLPVMPNPPADDMTSRASSSAINPLWAIPVISLAATRDRPIFSPSRRAPAAVSQTPVQSQPPDIVEPSEPSLSLVGAVAGEREGIAIFRDETTKSIVKTKTGETVSGWTLLSVRGREATLQKGRETAILAILNPPGH